jgi:hypothetical protein
VLKHSGINLDTGCFWKSGSRISGFDTISILMKFILILRNYHTDTGSGKNVGSFSSSIQNTWSWKHLVQFFGTVARYRWYPCTREWWDKKKCSVQLMLAVGPWGSFFLPLAYLCQCTLCTDFILPYPCWESASTSTGFLFYFRQSSSFAPFPVFRQYDRYGPLPPPPPSMPVAYILQNCSLPVPVYLVQMAKSWYRYLSIRIIPSFWPVVLEAGWPFHLFDFQLHLGCYFSGAARSG